MPGTGQIPLLIERLARILQNDAHIGGLKPTQWEALRYLARANRFSRSPSAVTLYLGMTKGTVSQSLATLERKGLVVKKGEAADRRSIRIDVTASGLRALERDPVAAMEAAVQRMSKADRAALSQTLEKVLQQLLQERGGRAFGACRTCRHFRKSHAQGAPHYCSLLGEKLSAEDGEHSCVEHELAA